MKCSESDRFDIISVIIVYAIEIKLGKTATALWKKKKKDCDGNLIWSWIRGVQMSLDRRSISVSSSFSPSMLILPCIQPCCLVLCYP